MPPARRASGRTRGAHGLEGSSVELTPGPAGNAGAWENGKEGVGEEQQALLQTRIDEGCVMTVVTA